MKHTSTELSSCTGVIGIGVEMPKCSLPERGNVFNGFKIANIYSCMYTK